jgi:hypothetical protein
LYIGRISFFMSTLTPTKPNQAEAYPVNGQLVIWPQLAKYMAGDVRHLCLCLCSGIVSCSGTLFHSRDSWQIM